MRNLRLSIILLLGLALSTAAAVAQSQETLPSAPSAAVEPLVKFTSEFGAEGRFFSSGDRWTKFVQNRDIPDNFTVNTLNFSIGRESSRWSLIGSALDAGQLDQRYRLVLEKFGASQTSFRFISYPNYISRAVTSPYVEVSPGVLGLPTPIRSAFEVAATDAARIAVVRDLVANSPLIDLRTRRQRFLFDQNFHLTNHWFVNANVVHERRRGHRPLGVGAYNRSQGPVGGGATWVAFSDELPEPVDYRTTEVRAGIGYQADRGMIRIDYTGSWFSNEVKNLVWLNPFQVTPLTSAGPGAAPGTAGRWRFDRDQIYINPDNRAHTLSFTGRLKLPADSFFSALLTYSMRRQDSLFDPYTLNGAVFPTTGANAPPAGVVVTDASTLPQRSLNGEVNTTTGSAVLGTRHWKTLLLTAHYRAFNYDNETPVVPLPGIIDMSSFWTSNFDGTPVTAFEVPSSYLRQNASVEAVWRPNRQFQFRLAPSLETWNRTRRQVRRLNEWGGDASIIAEPVKWLNAKVTYHYGDRIPESAYVRAPNEFEELRAFDQDRRITNNPAVVLNFGGKGPWLVSANYSYMSQAHDRNFFGLSKYLRGVAGVDVNYAPSDRWGVAAYYNHERIGYRYRSIAKENAPFEFAASDEWNRATRDKVDSFGVAFNALSSNQKWQFNANYDFSFANQQITTTNPAGAPVYPIDAGGHPFPDVRSHFQELFLDSSYAFRSNWRLGVRYIFSPYRLEDFATDNLTPYLPTQSATPAPGTIDPQTNAVRFLVLNSRYASADSHMVGVYIRYSF